MNPSAVAQHRRNHLLKVLWRMVHGPDTQVSRLSMLTLPKYPLERQSIQNRYIDRCDCTNRPLLARLPHTLHCTPSNRTPTQLAAGLCGQLQRRPTNPPTLPFPSFFQRIPMEKERGKETIHLHPTRTAIASSSFRTEQVQICVRAPVRCFRAASNCYHPGPPSLLFEFFLFFCQIANKPFGAV